MGISRRDHEQDADKNIAPTYTRDQIEEINRRENLRKAGGVVAGSQIPDVDGEYAEFLAWKAAKLTPNQPSVVHRCGDCAQQFNTAQGLRMHMTKKHPPGPA